MAHQWKPSVPSTSDSANAPVRPQTKRLLGSPVTSNGHFHEPSKGHFNGWSSGANGVANGTLRSLSEAPADLVSNGCVDSDDDDDFYGAEERSCCSDGDYHDATDALEASSDSEGSSNTPGRGHRTSYKSLLARLQEEQAKCAALEASLQQERAHVRGTVDTLTASKQQGRNGVHLKESKKSKECLGRPGAENVTAARAGDDAKHVVALMVANAIGRAAGRAEVQLESEALLQQKEKELSRLRDKLQYWERMNQEMSQQNTEAIEMLRQRRRMWKTVYRVTYVIGAVALGVGLIAAVNLATSSTKGESSAKSSSSEADSS